MTPKVWVFAICRNEKPMMGYFLRHYSTFAERIIIFDGHSNDGTREIISSCSKAEMRDWPGSDALCDDEFLAFANEQWKEARGHADWVMWADCDELIYHPKMLEVLSQYLQDGVEVPQILGYTMVSQKFPTTEGQIYEEVKTGFPDDVWNKGCVFRVHMHWNMGRHSLNFDKFQPKNSPSAEIKLLHYRGLGVDYVRERHRRNWERVPEHCRRQNFGTNTSPQYVGHHGILWFEEMLGRKWPNII